MAVAALVLGILGFVVFSWLGPMLGAGWAAQATFESFADASKTGLTPEVITWPLWTLGLIIGVGFPLVAVVLGGIALSKDQSKGVAIGGLVSGAVGAISGFVLIFVFQAMAALGQAAVGQADPQQFQQGIQQLQQQLNDPAMQQQIQQQLQQAMQQAGQQQQMQPTPQPQPMQPMQPAQPQPQPAQP